MGITLCILGSGSAGNCILFGSAATRMLIDAGLSGRETVRRLEVIGVDPATLQAVCVTHEHGDHIAGLRALRTRFGLELYANSGTIDSIRTDDSARDLKWRVFATGFPFDIGDIRVEPFSVPHDACEPVGFILSAGGIRAGIVTDIGVVTHLVRERLRQCEVLVLESNHDEQLLRASPRPWQLKQRIAGRQGHLSNQTAADLIVEVAGERLTDVFLAHISAECNQPELALKTIRTVLCDKGLSRIRLRLTYPDRVSDVWTRE